MSPPGGGKVNQPGTGQQIVKEMFESGQQEKLTTQQQTQQLRQQAKAQQDLRQATESQGKEESGEARQEKTEGRQEAQQTRAKGGRTEVRDKGERQMDGFLSRASTQQKGRQAGKEFSRDRQVRSHGVQSWSVYNSRQTSPKARQTILARQAKTQTQQRTLQRAATHANPSTNVRSYHTQGPITPTLRNLMRPESQGPSIRYALPQSQGGRERPPLSSQRFTLQNFSKQLARMAVQAQAKGDRSGQSEKAGAQAQLKGSLLFVRDGKKLRAFKLQKDGSLSELPSEDSSEEPLSNEARAAIRKVLSRKGIHSEGKGKNMEKAGELSETELAELVAEQKALESESGEGALDFETKFALLLYEVLEEHKKLGKKLGRGENPNFPSKKDWAAFFAKLAQTGNQEKAGKKSLDEILSLMFRGLFNKKGKGQYLVGDLKYSKDGRAREEKFTQVSIDNEDLMKLLAQIKPGQQINPEILKKFFGEELSYLLMAHAAGESYNMAGTAEKNVAFNPKAVVDPYSQARLEHSIFSQKQKAAKGKELASQVPLMDSAPSHPHGVFANVYELLGLRKLYEGKPKRYTLVAYLILASILGIGISLALF